jgi:3-hydroxyisobutyrate dehydrogenase-like beta-hydroxyacid dehydrogenase
MSTVSTVASSRVAEAARAAGVSYLRAPVSGTVASAIGKTLTIFASGPKEAYANVSRFSWPWATPHSTSAAARRPASSNWP